MTNSANLCIMNHVAEVSNTKGAHGSIAQLGEHLPYKQEVTGSSPVVPTINMALWCSRLARQPVTLEVDGSSPFGVAIMCCGERELSTICLCSSVGRAVD